MKPVDKYKSAAGFRMAVKSKLNKISQNTGQDIRRLYRQPTPSLYNTKRIQCALDNKSPEEYEEK